MPAPLPRNLYIQHVLELYRLMPGTIGRIRRSDRHLAGSLHDRGIPIDIVTAALLLAAARRIFRSGEPLSPIASLHYIRPVIDELLAQSSDSDYVDYLCHKLASVAPDFATAAHQLS
ncbi:MAG TPA: hypothetical protein VM166_00025 [Gemmatimonadaceae bacterium]|nr:hypothetical protein [Gemmatimonadaceae bacterium]